MLLFCILILFFFCSWHSLTPEGLVIPCELLVPQGWEALYRLWGEWIGTLQGGVGHSCRKLEEHALIFSEKCFQNNKKAMYSDAIFGKRLCDVSSHSLPPSITSPVLFFCSHNTKELPFLQLRCYYKNQCLHTLNESSAATSICTKSNINAVVFPHTVSIAHF